MKQRMVDTVAFIMVAAGATSVLWYCVGNVIAGTMALIAACAMAIMLMFRVEDV